VVNRYAPKFSPGDIEPDIVRALKEPAAGQTVH
jgi:hypothetical protein